MPTTDLPFYTDGPRSRQSDHLASDRRTNDQVLSSLLCVLYRGRHGCSCDAQWCSDADLAHTFVKTLRNILFPDRQRKLPHARAWNIALRTAHIAVSGILFGGHVFDIAAERLLIWLYLSILTGVGLIVIEAYPSCRWFYQGRGVFVLAKLVLLGIIPVLWDYRVAILSVVIVIASVGSHMPGRFRYYSLLHRRVLE